LILQVTTEAGDVVRRPAGYSFGPFRLDVGRGSLLCAGEEIALRPKSFDVLLFLVRNAQRLVSRNELLKAAWPGVLVTDDSLTQCLIDIRKALGDDRRTIVRTVPRRGYRFELPVQEITDGAAPVRARVPASVHAAPAAAAARLPSRWTLAALAVLAVALAATWWRAGPDGAGTRPVPAHAQPAVWQPPAASIAVLPFADMSPEGDQEYLADGIAEEILNLLAQVHGLTVIARTSSFSFRGQELDIGTIARRLNAAHVLEGSVRKSGDRVRVTAQLVDGGTGAHLWSETYDRQLGDVFATQDEIAQGVTEVLRSRLLGDAGKALASGGAPAYVPDGEAWDLYLRGRYLYGRRMAGDRVQAQRYFEQALEIDPGFAAAWVSLAAIHNVRIGETGMPEEERISREEAEVRIRHALERALQLDPDQAEALLRMGQIRWREGRVAEGLELVTRAMRLGRNHSLVQALLGGWAYLLGDPAVGAELQGRAVALDPVNAVHLGNYGIMLYSAGRLEEAAAALDSARVLNPELALQDLDYQVGLAMARGDFRSASELAAGLPPGVRRDRAQAMLAFRAGDRPASNAALQRIQESTDPEAPAHRVVVHAFRGEPDAAFEALDDATGKFAALSDWITGRHLAVQLRSSPFLRPLHADPRWSAWVQRSTQALQQPGQEQILALLRDYAAQGPEA
jgi:TolB-like protein/DNA-binding winged helix-turn-helix (wHTH) protein/tetratricopeptide (TPR) repeat protein